MRRQRTAQPRKVQPTPKATPDQGPPKALVDFMMSGWQAPSRKPVSAIDGAERFAARRRALSRQFKGQALVIPTGHEKVRANDTNYPFRPGSDFYYLTGNLEADCVLILWPKGSGHQELLFVEPEVDRSTPAFFTDRARGALWVGARLGIDGSRQRYGVDQALPLGELQEWLGKLAKGAAPHRVLRGLSPAVDGAVPAREAEDRELAKVLSEMRLYKDDAEVAALRQAIRSTRRALEDALLALRTAKTEREVEVAFDARARAEGHGVGYGTIIAAGSHATVLHWTRNDGPVRKGDLVLIDAGVEGPELYTGDITRTVPASGRFSREQRALYDLVTAAQDAAIRACRPGNDFVEPHRVAMRVLAEGLERLGVLREPAEEALREDRQTYKRYTLHNTSHMLGIDVHDGSATTYRQGKLEPGMVLTIEPGLYFQADDLTVPARYRGIGIRVEEDVLVTEGAPKVLSSDIPRTADEIEKWMAEIWKKRG